LSWGALSKLLAVRVGGMPKGALPPFLCADVFSAALINQKACLALQALGGCFPAGLFNGYDRQSHQTKSY